MTIEPSEIQSASILIVDDQTSNVHLLEQLLAEAGYRDVSSTMDPRAVCTLHQHRDYDLILLDFLMPDMDVFQVIAALRSNAA